MGYNATYCILYAHRLTANDLYIDMSNTYSEGQQLEKEILSRVNDGLNRMDFLKTVPSKENFMFLLRLCSVLLF